MQKKILSMLSQTEENYIKAIYKISQTESKSVSTNAISKLIHTKAASVTDMLQRLSEKNLVHYEKYKGVNLTEIGKKIATQLVRKHRLWEVFLVNKLHFSWEEVHDIAEELEHINSDKLIKKLDEYLGFPKFDPHGDPIPNHEGKFTLRQQISLSDMNEGESGQVIGVKIHDTPFLEHLNEIGIQLNTNMQVIEKKEYDQTRLVLIGDNKKTHISEKVANQLLMKKL